MRHLHNKELCCGCSSCAQICPHVAITMQEDTEGFLCPIINTDKCVDCGLCDSVCPAQDLCFRRANDFQQEYFAAYSSKFADGGSSGGAFGIIATIILAKGGYICGAAFTDNWLVRHIVSNNPSVLSQIRGSKYLQSDINMSFVEIQKLLNSGSWVLFSGTPCQCAGLDAFLGKRYDTLILVDVICHGVPSPTVWQAYLQEFSNGEPVQNVRFRDKNAAQNDTLHETSPEHRYFSVNWNAITHAESPYYMAFLNNLILRKSCSNCLFSGKSRSSDITLGDLRGPDYGFDKGKGISLVIVNTQQGSKLFNLAREYFDKIQPLVFEKLITTNKYVNGETSMPISSRASFFSGFSKDKKNVSELIEYHLGVKDVALLNFNWPQPNYGAHLVAFSLERAVCKLGYRAYSVNYIPSNLSFTTPSVFWNFRNTFLNLTDIAMSKDVLASKINPRFNKLIFGSDQIWRFHRDYVYYGDWVSGNKTMIAYAASFGHDKAPNVGKHTKELLNRFDAISVREKSGVRVCMQEFGVKACHMIDPTMLLSAEDYSEIIDKESSIQIDGDFVATYFLDSALERKCLEPAILAEIKYEMPFINAYKDDSSNFRPVGEWLNLIKHAKYVITDSFHGMVFCILFQKQFMVVHRDTGGNERLKSLCEMLSINMDRIAKDITQVSLEGLRTAIDYIVINSNITKYRAIGMEFLKTSLAIKPNKKQTITAPSNISHSSTTIRYRLFGCIPLIKVKRKDNKKKYYLFNLLPLLKTKIQGAIVKVYLFGFMYIAKAKK